MTGELLPDPALRRALAGVLLLVLDFDGVLTDNTVTVTSEGVESVTCWRSDGIGLAAVRRAGVAVHILSTETDRLVSVRAAKLELPVTQGLEDKAAALEALLLAQGVPAAACAYVGNDVNDLGCLRAVGLPIVVADAHPDVLDAARYVTRAPGGRGAVREVCDLLLAARAERGTGGSA